MTTDYHDPIPALSAAVPLSFNLPLGQLDDALGGVAATGSAFPGSPAAGDRFYRTDQQKLYVYNGSSWIEVATVASSADGINVSGTAGENLAERNHVYLDSDNKWYKVDTDADPPKCGRVRGLVVASGGITSGNAGSIRRLGSVSGFTGLTAGAPVYASTTAGALTQTRPNASDGAGQLALLIVGVALSTTEVFVGPWHKVAYMLRESTLPNGSSLTLKHHSDPAGKAREARAYVSTSDSNLLENYDGSADLLTSLESWWKMDETSGTRSDSHGSNNLTDNNTVLYAAGKQGNAADLERTNAEYLSLASNSSLQTGDVDYSFSVWFKPESANVNMGIIAKGVPSTLEHLLYYDNATKKVLFYVYNGSAGVVGTCGGPSLAAGTWYHLVVYHSATANEVGMILNGESKWSASTTGAAGSNSQNFLIGNYDTAGGGFEFDGLIDEVGYWKGRALTVDEARLLYNEGAGCTYEDLTKGLFDDKQLQGQTGAGGTTSGSDTGTNAAVGDTAGTDYEQAQSFQVTAGQLTQFKFKLNANSGSPVGQIMWRIYDDNSGAPGTVLAEGQCIPTASAVNTVNVNNGPFLAASTTYWLGLQSVVDQASGVAWNWDKGTTGTYANGSNSYRPVGGSWTNNSTHDCYFEVTTSAVTQLQKLCQSFQLTAQQSVGTIVLPLRKVGSPTGTLTIRIETDSSGSPSGTLVDPNATNTSNLVAESGLGTSFADATFELNDSVTLNGTTTYWIVLETSRAQSNTNYIEWKADINPRDDYADGTMKYHNGTSWTAFSSTVDGWFEVGGAITIYEEPCVIGRWAGGSRDIAVRFDDGALTNGDTRTTFKNVSGAQLDVTVVVELD